MSYWGTGYWGTGYWADGYWAENASTPAVGSSSLYVERVVEVVKLTLKRKTSGSDTFYISQEYWDEGMLYVGNPVIYPVLVEPVPSPRSIRNNLGVRHDVSIPIYGKSHFSAYGMGFGDLLDQYELRGSSVEVRRYFRTRDGIPSHDDDDNIRQTLEIVGADWSEDVFTLNCRDTLFEDREISRQLDPAVFSGLEDDWKYEYGAVVFGEGEAGNGVIVDTPYIESGMRLGTTPFANVFTGWVADGHPNHSVVQFYARNNDKQQDVREWLELSLVADPSAPYSGQAGTSSSFPDIGDTYPRHLSEYTRAIVVSPASQAVAIIAMRAAVKARQLYWAADFIGSNNLYRIGDKAFSPGPNKSFTIACWVNFDTIQEQGIVGKGQTSDGTAEWALTMRGTGQITFGVSSDGTASDKFVSWGSAASTGTWYFVVAWHDAVNRQIGIQVNNGTPVTASTVNITGTAQGGGADADTGLGYITLANTASASNDAYLGQQIFITGGPGQDDVRYCLSYQGSNRRFWCDPNISPKAENTTTYAIHHVPNNRKPDGTDKDGPLQVGYIGGLDHHLDGKVAMLGFWSDGVVDPTYRTSIYNGGNGKAFENLDDNEKFNLAAWWDLNEFYGIRKDAAGSKDLSDAGSVGSDVGKVATVVTSDHGELRGAIYYAKFLSDADTYAPDGSVLRNVALDAFDSSTKAGGFADFEFATPLIMSPDVNYLCLIEWTNKKDHPYAFWCNYRSSSGQVHYARAEQEKEKGWSKQADVQLAMELFAVGTGLSAFVSSAGSGLDRFSYYNLESFALGFDYEFNRELVLKAAVKGLKDDSSGTYTGSANSVMRNVAHILRFVLQNESFLGIDPSLIRSATIETLNDDLGSAYRLAFAIDQKTTGWDLIQKMTKQADFCFFKTRRGQLAAARSSWHAGVFDHSVDEGLLRDQLQIEGLADTPLDRIYNDFSINFGIDKLNTPKDPAFIRRAGSDSWGANVYLNGDESSDGDATREANMAASQALYGKLEYRADFDLYPADSTAPLQVLKRLADRYRLKGKRLTFRVPLKDYYATDLLEHWAVRHTELPAKNGTAKRFVWHDDGQEIAWHHRGVPVRWMKLGRIEGEVTDLVEQDQWLIITIETQNPF